MPMSYEERKVLNTGNYWKIHGGVASINFREEPERLVAIIATEENTERLKSLANETGIDMNIIVTHNDFLEMCKEKYRGKVLRNNLNI